jgi:hypothetical protein
VGTTGAVVQTAAPFTFSATVLWVLRHWQPLLAFLSAGIAWIAITKNQDINRRRATLDLIEKSESSEHYRVILATFREYLVDGDDAKKASLHDAKNKDVKLARRQVQQFLNHYELVAIGVLGKSLHEKTYREWMMTVVIRDWNTAADYIQRERWKYDTVTERWVYTHRPYTTFERLAVKWAKRCNLKAIKISSTTSSPPAVPTGPADIAIPKLDESITATQPGAANIRTMRDSDVPPVSRM